MRAPRVNIQEIVRIANMHGFVQCAHQTEHAMISFKKGETRINVYYTTMTVTTCLRHPKHGKTQLFRRHVDAELLALIFQNPRVHTGRGYKEKDVTRWQRARQRFIPKRKRRQRRRHT